MSQTFCAPDEHTWELTDRLSPAGDPFYECRCGARALLDDTGRPWWIKYALPYVVTEGLTRSNSIG